MSIGLTWQQQLCIACTLIVLIAAALAICATERMHTRLDELEADLDEIAGQHHTPALRIESVERDQADIDQRVRQLAQHFVEFRDNVTAELTDTDNTNGRHAVREAA